MSKKIRIAACVATMAVLSCGASAMAANNSSAANATLTIRADQPGARIDPALHGQFMEHLGRNVYEGIWVGEDSPIPNTRGYRNDVLAALKKLQIPVLRWPGGCFADEYHWRDGIGDRSKRPHRVNTFWGGVIEPNTFGTHEFFELAELLGAKTYLAVNVGSGTVQEMSQWVEYITSPSQSTLANERRANGRDKPWKLDYIGVGNEPWGCGGDMQVGYYSDEYRKFALNIKTPKDNTPIRVASGAYGVYVFRLADGSVQQQISSYSGPPYYLYYGDTVTLANNTLYVTSTDGNVYAYTPASTTAIQTPREPTTPGGLRAGATSPAGSTSLRSPILGHPAKPSRSHPAPRSTNNRHNPADRQPVRTTAAASDQGLDPLWVRRPAGPEAPSAGRPGSTCR